MTINNPGIIIPTAELVARIATTKAIDDKAYKELSTQLGEGSYPVDARIRIAGGIKKGKPYEQTVPAAANPWKLLAVAFSKLNAATVESIVQSSIGVADGEAEVVKAAAQEAIERITAGTVRTISGRVTASLTWGLEA